MPMSTNSSGRILSHTLTCVFACTPVRVYVCVCVHEFFSVGGESGQPQFDQATLPGKPQSKIEAVAQNALQEPTEPRRTAAPSACE